MEPPPTEQQPGTLVCLLSPAGKGAVWSLWDEAEGLCREQSLAIVAAEDEATVASVCTHWSIICKLFLATYLDIRKASLCL